MNDRVTQADVARLAGVSQATVSMVLNGRTEGGARIAEATRLRVLEAIERTGYTANPFAQGLARGHNRIFGVFTYESVFPRHRADFYYPFLMGIEASAEELGLDLLLFTSAPATAGRRHLSETGWNRLGVTDGCILLGRHDDKFDIATLLKKRFPFVFIGRRESSQGEVPYMGADYISATRHVVEHLLRMRHQRIAFLGDLGAAESSVDRVTGYREAMAAAGVRPMMFEHGAFSAQEAVDLICDHGATAAVLGADYGADDIRSAARTRGLRVPDDLSLAILGEPERPLADDDWTGFRIPRVEMGAEALRLLADRISGHDEMPVQQLLPCRFVEGGTVKAL